MQIHHTDKIEHIPAVELELRHVLHAAETDSAYIIRQK